MVSKSNTKWWICVNYIDQNKACPKDPYLLSSIDGLVNATSGFRFLSLMNVYSRYNQIPRYPCDEEKTAFIIPTEKYCYKVMSFGLKNAGATYQD